MKFKVSDIIVIAIASAAWGILIANFSFEEGTKLTCESKGLKLKTPSYDVKKKKITLWCE